MAMPDIGSSTTAPGRRLSSHAHATTRKRESGLSAAKPVRIFIVDDHPPIRLTLKKVFGNCDGFELCGEAATASEAYQMLEKQSADVVILDLMFDDAHGLEITQNLRSWYPDLKILVYSAHNEQLYAARCIKAGANGYVEKCRPIETLLDAVKTVYQGRIYVSSEMLSSMLFDLVTPGKGQNFSEILLDLTDRELEIFELLGRGYSTEEIESVLHLCRKTIEMHRRSLKDKLGFNSLSDLHLFAAHLTALQV